jgi:hypothetical protein
LIAAGAVWWAIEYPVTRTIADLESGNGLRMQAAIEQMATLSPTERSEALAAAREEIIASSDTGSGRCAGSIGMGKLFKRSGRKY